MVCTCSSFSLSRSVPEKSAYRVSTECTWSIGPMGCTGGADRTFVWKSQECLWQDWYIYSFGIDFIPGRQHQANKNSLAEIVDSLLVVWYGNSPYRFSVRAVPLKIPGQGRPSPPFGQV